LAADRAHRLLADHPVDHGDVLAAVPSTSPAKEDDHGGHLYGAAVVGIALTASWL